MTVSEFGALVASIKTYYPRDNFMPNEQAMDLWYQALADLDYKSAHFGVQKYVATNKFPPAISDIRECAMEFNNPHNLNESEAWSLVRKAISNSGYNSAEEYAKLPPLVQKAVGLSNQLRIWALDENYSESVVSSNFIKCYRAELAKTEQTEKMPTEMRKRIEAVNEGYGLEIKPYIAIEEKEIHEGVPMPEHLKQKLSKNLGGE